MNVNVRKYISAIIAPFITSQNDPCKKTDLQDNLEAGYAPVYSHIIGVQAMPYCP